MRNFIGLLVVLLLAASHAAPAQDDDDTKAPPVKSGHSKKHLHAASADDQADQSSNSDRAGKADQSTSSAKSGHAKKRVHTASSDDQSSDSDQADTSDHSTGSGKSGHSKKHVHPASSDDQSDQSSDSDQADQSDSSGKDHESNQSSKSDQSADADKSDDSGKQKSASLPTIVTPLDTSDLQDFDANSPAVRLLIEKCLPLTHQNLGYIFGSSDPSAGGMDCSGTIFYVLRAVGITDIPRTASDQYVWARKADNFEAVVSRKKDSFELDDMHPGDLLFWTGTYATDRDPPVTHTMIYLGKLKSDGRQVMFGSSDGRTYDGKKMYGVSVFDFSIPKAHVKGEDGGIPSPGSVFIGYAHIPGIDHATANPPKAKDDD